MMNGVLICTYITMQLNTWEIIFEKSICSGTQIHSQIQCLDHKQV